MRPQRGYTGQGGYAPQLNVLLVFVLIRDWHDGFQERGERLKHPDACLGRAVEGKGVRPTA